MTAAGRVPKPIVELLSLVMRDVGAVGKGDRNEDEGFRFRGVDAVVNAASPAFRRRGVVVLPTVLSVDSRPIEVGQKATHCIVRVRYTFHGPAGDSLAVEVPGEAIDAGDKAVSKAMSVAFRIALLQALCLPTCDPDPDAAVYKRGPVEAPPNAVQRALSRHPFLVEIGELADRTGVTREELSARFYQTNQVDIRVAAPALLEPVLLELRERAAQIQAQEAAAAAGPEETGETT